MNSRYWRRARRLTVSERRLLLRHGRSLAAVALFHALLVVALWLWGTLDAGGLYVSLQTTNTRASKTHLEARGAEE